MRASQTLVVAGCLLASCGSGVSELPPRDAIQDLLTATLPEGWSLIEAEPDQAPPGHGPVQATGWRFVLLGPEPVSFQWKDASGEWHAEKLARETLELWVMPGSYRPSWRMVFEHHGHVPPERIYRSESIRVYGQISHRIVAEERFNELLGIAYSTSWSDISEKTCSWQGWSQALAAGFGAVYH